MARGSLEKHLFKSTADNKNSTNYINFSSFCFFELEVLNRLPLS
jgi:hypothetical protein